MAKRYNIVILAIGQAVQELDKVKRLPTMSDVYGGSAVNQDSDGVCFLMVDKSGGEKWISGDEYWPTKMIWVKNRHGGEGTVRFMYYPQYHRFTAEAAEYAEQSGNKDEFVEIEDDGTLPF